MRIAVIDEDFDKESSAYTSSEVTLSHLQKKPFPSSHRVRALFAPSNKYIGAGNHDQVAVRVLRWRNSNIPPTIGLASSGIWLFRGRTRLRRVTPGQGSTQMILKLSRLGDGTTSA